MKRALRLLIVPLAVGLLMLATAAPAFAIGPPDGLPPGDLSSVPGHEPSCAAQNPDDRPDGAKNSAPFEDLQDFYDKFC